MTTATAHITCYDTTGARHQSAIWSALIEWPFGYRFVSALSRRDLIARVDAVSRAIGRKVVVS